MGYPSGNGRGERLMENIEELLSELPEKVAIALQVWRLRTLERKRIEAVLYLRHKGEDPKMTKDEINAHIELDAERHQKMLEEIMAETKYKELSDEQMAVKKKASIRVQY